MSDLNFNKFNESFKVGQIYMINEKYYEVNKVDGVIVFAPCDEPPKGTQISYASISG